MMTFTGLRRFLRDRYGMDQLNAALLLSCLALLSAAVWISPWYLTGAAMAATALLLRALSRDYDARRAENGRFRRLAAPAHQLRRVVRRDRSYRYCRCASCGRSLRIPKRDRGAVCRCACGKPLK